MREIVRLGPAPRSSPFKRTIVFALVAGAGAGAFYAWRNRPSPSQTPLPPEAPSAASPAALPPSTLPASLQQPPQSGLATGLAPSGLGSAPLAAASAQPAPAQAPNLGGSPIRHAKVQIQGALESSLALVVGGKLAPALAQVVARQLVWWVTVPRDLKKSDTLDLLYEERASSGDEPLLHAIRFVSEKTGKTHSAYRFKAPGEPYAHYYQPSGEEVELRLTHSPVQQYEQITSLIRDGRRHKGVDFKTAVGTDVRAPFAGTITRRNWNFRGNGNSLELSEAGGKRKALFLHLDALPDTAKVGTRVAVSEVMAKSGNSGHSFAPHLHYQLMSSSDKVLDPFTEQQTFRRSLDAEVQPVLEAEIRKLDALWAPAAVAKEVR